MTVQRHGLSLFITTLIGSAVVLWAAVAEMPTAVIANATGTLFASDIDTAPPSAKASGVKELEMAVVHNLVKNPGVEDADSDSPDRPAGFVPKTAGRGNSNNIKFTWESTGLNKGKCIAIDAKDVYLGYWETIVPVKPQKQYLISVRYKCGSGIPSSLKDIYTRLRNIRPGGPNLELGVVSRDGTDAGATKDWSDASVALGPVGGIYLPVATEWASFNYIVATAINQNYMSLKLRMFCSIQKVWFDDIIVAELSELPKIQLISPSSNAVLRGTKVQLQWKGLPGGATYFVEYSRSPLYVIDRTRHLKITSSRLRIAERLQEGLWFWRVGVPEQHGLPVWVAEGKFHVGYLQWVESDTTPPAVNLPSPLPNANVAPDASVAAQFDDVGSGVDVKSATILLDGKDVTVQATVTEKGFLFFPPQPLTSGAHQVEAYVSDKAGNVSNLLTWRFGVGKTLEYAVKIKDRRVLLNDKPYFPVGIWNYRCHPGDRRFDEGHLAAASAAGVDVLINTLPPGLDIIHKHRMKSLLNITLDLKDILNAGGTAAAAEKALFGTGDPNKGQAQFKNHPAVLGYWADDPENIENSKEGQTPRRTIETLNAARDSLKRYDPDHVLVWAISNLPRLQDSGKSADILLMYRYPIPHYHPKVIDDYTLSYAIPLFPLKPVFFNSQAFDLRSADTHYIDPKDMRPTVAEIRAMAYYAITFGISGYSFYANYLNREETPEHWAAVLRTAGELRHLGPALSSGKRSTTASQQLDGTSGSIYYREIEYEDAHLLIAVNMSAGTIDATWKFEKAKQVVVLFENRMLRIPSAKLCDLFGPFGVHVYQWRD